MKSIEELTSIKDSMQEMVKIRGGLASAHDRKGDFGAPRRNDPHIEQSGRRFPLYLFDPRRTAFR
jgi:hypothetical protein